MSELKPQPEPNPEQTEATTEPQRVTLAIPLFKVYATWVLLVLNILIFAIPSLFSLFGIPLYEWTLVLGAKDNRAIFLGGEIYRLLTAIFLHGGLAHLLFNAWSLYSLGIETERFYGTGRFLAVYFVAGLAGSLASYALSPNPSVGASGAIFGLIGALGVVYYLSRRLFGEFGQQQLGMLITVLMINLFMGFSTPRIDNFAHLGGLVGGLIAGWLLTPRLVLNQQVYPPAVERQNLSVAWPALVGVVALLGVLFWLIRPPLLPF
jgi:rhomboid protease GluP